MSSKYRSVSPKTQRAIVSEYKANERGSGMKALASKHGLSPSTVRHIVERANMGGGDPVTPRGHRKRVLDSEQVAILESTLDQNPLATNRDLAAAVDNVIAPRTVSLYLKRADPPFTTKVIQDQPPEEKTPKWKKETKKWVRHVKDIRMDRRIYADETPVYANEAPKKGRSRRGQPIFRARTKYAKRYTLHMYVKKTHVVHWELCDINANTEEVERVAAAAALKMNEGDVVIWDRLGRSGRCASPTAQHYIPEAKASFEAVGATVEFLPPKGKYCNPIELLFNDLKSHYVRPAFPGNGKNLTKEQIESIIDRYVCEEAARTLPGFFVKRASSADVKEKI
jgi:transposase